MAYTTINKSTDYFNTKLYTGTGSSQVITGVGFQPDLIWTATRNESEIRPLNDSVNGINNYLRSNATDTLETSGSNITAQSSDGYTVGTENRFNQSSNTFVSWNWKANGQGSANTDGTVNSTYTSASSTSGFSIVKWTHTTSGNYTVGHGLNATPKMIIVKTTNATTNWGVYHSALTVGQRLILNSTSAQTTGYWGANSWTNNTFSIGSGRDDNGKTMIAYCFAEKTGFSKFGSFTASNPGFVYTGFKPTFVMLKRYSATGNWFMLDNKRANSFNPQDPLYANSTDAEQTGDDYDLISNGFIIKNASGGGGGDSGSMLYMAFGQPIVSTNGDIATAR